MQQYNLIALIAKAIGRQLTNISKQITRLLKWVAKPFAYINKFVRAQVKSMTRKPSSPQDYVRVFGTHVSKRLVALIFIGAIAVGLLITNFVYPWMEGRLWIPRIVLNSPKMASYTGPAKIVNDVGTLIYQGDVDAGVITGSGYQYDPDGALVYAGELRAAQYNGRGTQYVDGVVRYEGDFIDNLYDGEGRLYNEAGALIYQGSFAQGVANGKGRSYREDTHTLSYYGDFVGGVHEGTGVAYEQDGKTVQYQGQFSGGLYSGMGTYYENGVMRYTGAFAQGQYEGQGTLYDERGIVCYTGAFSKGVRQGSGTVYDALGAELYTGAFLSDGVNYVSYLGAGQIDLIAAFGNPGYTQSVDGMMILSYLNLGTSFLCVDADGKGSFTCDRILVDIDTAYLTLTRDATPQQIEALLGARFSSLDIAFSSERVAALGHLSIDHAASARVDKYLMDTYYIKLIYDAAGVSPIAIECGGY